MQISNVVCVKVDRVKLSVATSRVNFENETALSEKPVVKLQGMFDMTPRRLLSSYGRCERLQCFQFLGKEVDVSKRRKTRTHRHRITSQKKWIFSNAHVRNSDLVYRAFVLRAVFHVLPEEEDAACLRNGGYLGAFAELRKMTVSFVMSVCSVCLSIGMESLGYHWTDFHEIWYMSIYRKSVTKIDFSLKCDKNNVYFTWKPMYICDNISLTSPWSEKCFGQM